MIQCVSSNERIHFYLLLSITGLLSNYILYRKASGYNRKNNNLG